MNDTKAQRSSIYFHIAAMLSILVPVPGLFAYGVLVLVLFNIQMASVTLFYHLVNRMRIENFRNILVAFEIIFVTVLYKQLLIVICPVAALSLGFSLYLPALSAVAISFFFDRNDSRLGEHLAASMSRSVLVTAYSLVYFLIREIVGYATFSVPGNGGIIVFHLPFFGKPTGAGVFLATVPGALALVAVSLLLVIFVRQKLGIVASALAAGNGEDEK